MGRCYPLKPDTKEVCALIFNPGISMKKQRPGTVIS